VKLNQKATVLRVEPSPFLLLRLSQQWFEDGISVQHRL
jgi:hypothetical protein